MQGTGMSNKRENGKLNPLNGWGWLAGLLTFVLFVYGFGTSQLLGLGAGVIVCLLLSCNIGGELHYITAALLGLLLMPGLGLSWVLAVPIVCVVIAALFFRSNPGVQTMLASLICILAGLLIGYIVLLLINPDGAGAAMETILTNFKSFKKESKQISNLGNTLVKTVPLLMCSLSVLFAYKVGLFNIGAAGQYVAGAGLGLYFAQQFDSPWWVCMIIAMLGGAALGAVSGLLKATRNVNEVISGIMLNWICLYLVNMLLAPYMDIQSNETFSLKMYHPGSMIPPSPILGTFLANPTNGKPHDYITLALELALVIAFAIWILMTRSRLGYELRATGLNKDAARYSGMRDRFNIILTMAIAGGLAGLGAAMFYLTNYMKWPMAVTSVPAMGFNGIAAAFLGGLHPIGAIFSSFFIQHITDGGSFMEKIYPSEIASLIAALIIYMCAFVLLLKQKIGKIRVPSRTADQKGGETK